MMNFRAGRHDWIDRRFSGVPSGRDFYFTLYQTPCVWLISSCPFGTMRASQCGRRPDEVNREPRERRERSLTRIPRIFTDWIVAERRRKLASYEVAGRATSKFIRPERTMDSAVLSGRILFRFYPARCAGLISSCPVGTMRASQRGRRRMR